MTNRGSDPGRDRVRPLDRFYFELLFASRSDPWNYTSAYEQNKYEQTLEFLRGRQFERALEVGCAEGRFTEQLAPVVGSLTAVDISQIALDRAAERCEHVPNVSFRQLDLTADDLHGPFDLIVCSEVLYYLGDRNALAAAARKLADALEPGGVLLTANANMLVDEPGSAGFDFPLPFGAKTIVDALAQTQPLRTVRSLSLPLYRIALFERADSGRPARADKRR